MSPEAKVIAAFGSPQLKRLLQIAKWGAQERITTSDVRERYGVSRATAKRDMAWLRKNGLVKGWRYRS